MPFPDSTRTRRTGAFMAGARACALALCLGAVGHAPQAVAEDAAPDTPEQWQRNVETVLYNQSALLARAFAGLEPQDPAKVDLYALLVAGDGTEEVFRREVAYVRELLDTRYGTRGRSLALVNSRTGVDRTPLATQHSLRAALQALARVMDVEQDVLLLFLTSHGSPDHALSLQMHGIELRDLPAAELARMLRESGIRHRIVIVSACYSGGFIRPLRDAHTLVITAARADRTSFGCADGNDFTYFGRALFKEALGASDAGGLSDAFMRASELVRQWEAEMIEAQPARSRAEGLALLRLHSEPQIDARPAWRRQVDRLWREWRRPDRPLP